MNLILPAKGRAGVQIKVWRLYHGLTSGTWDSTMRPEDYRAILVCSHWCCCKGWWCSRAVSASLRTDSSRATDGACTGTPHLVKNSFSFLKRWILGFIVSMWVLRIACFVLCPPKHLWQQWLATRWRAATKSNLAPYPETRNISLQCTFRKLLKSASHTGSVHVYI